MTHIDMTARANLRYAMFRRAEPHFHSGVEAFQSVGGWAENWSVLVFRTTL